MAIKASNQITITDITDAYAANLSSEAYVFTATGSTVPASSSCSTTVSALCGSTSIMPSIDTSEITFTAEGVSGNLSSSTTPKAPSVTKSDDTTNKLSTLTFSIGTGGTTKVIEATIPVHLDNNTVTITKKFTLGLTKQGQQGNPGQNGTSVTVSNVTYEYAKSTSGTTPPSSGWGTTPVAPDVNNYAWTRTTTTYSDSTTAVTYTVGGKVGQPGNPGQNGTSPTVTSTVTKYQKSTSGTTVPTGTWNSSALAPDVNNYVWTQTTITYSDGATAVTYAVAGKQGQPGSAGADAITVSITSSNGIIFKNNSGSTVLTAHVYKAGAEQTINDNGTVANSLGTVKWYKGTTLVATAKTLTVGAGDVVNSQAYTCQLES